MRVLDLFSAAAGGWSLGLHRAGFTTVAACEVIAWRRILYAENYPGVRLYDDVCTLTADELLRDLGALPDVIVGSPPCQDISSANTKGKGVDGERSGLFFEAVRLIGECRPRWFALENSARLRTKGADRVLGRLAALGYATEPCVVGADDVGANHERKRSWLIGFDPGQLADADGFRRHAGWGGRGLGVDIPAANDPEHAARVGHEGRRPWGHGSDGDGEASAARRHASHAEIGLRGAGEVESGGSEEDRRESPDISRDACVARLAVGEGVDGHPEPQRPAAERAARGGGDVAHADRQGEFDRAQHGEMGGGEGAGGDAAGPWAQWNRGLAGHLRLDDGLSAWVAQSRVAVGGPRGTSAASLLVEAFGDAVLPQIPEAIGRAILRTEAALAAIYGRGAA